MSMTAVDAAAARPLPTASGQAAGYGAIALVVLIWAGFALSIRAIGASPLATGDVALIRFGMPALLLLPFLPSRLQALRRIRPADGLMVLAGAGLPFFWIAAAGGAATSAAHVGALIAGTTPISVAFLAFLLTGKGPSARRVWGLAVIALGVLALIATRTGTGQGGGVVQGGVLLLAASLLWGAYTLGLRRTGLDAIGCTLLLTLPSFLMLLALIALGVVQTHLGRFAIADALPFLLVQGLGVGVIAALAYALAIARLGPARSAVIGALAPALASLGAIPILGEAVGPAVAVGVMAITAGVILANRS